MPQDVSILDTNRGQFRHKKGKSDFNHVCKAEFGQLSFPSWVDDFQLSEVYFGKSDFTFLSLKRGIYILYIPDVAPIFIQVRIFLSSPIFSFSICR